MLTLTLMATVTLQPPRESDSVISYNLPYSKAVHGYSSNKLLPTTETVYVKMLMEKEKKIKKKKDCAG